MVSYPNLTMLLKALADAAKGGVSAHIVDPNLYKD
jgi:hypothetical protein